MRRFIYETLHPDLYHGRKARPPYFEGWYFKLVDAQQERSWAVIPGIYYGYDPAVSQAFVMVLDGRTHQTTFHHYPVSAFAAAVDQFQIRVGPNLFSAEFMTLNLPDVHGHLTFHDRVPWPVSWKAPGIMGWYGWFPMECYHGVVSLDHSLRGYLVAGDETVDFNGGRGYIEKDWGRNFPQTWIWMQANHFAVPGVSLTASTARIPFYGRVFPGFIIGVWLGGQLYRFTTYLGSTLEHVSLNGDLVRIVAHNERYQLHLEAHRGPTALLYAPTTGKGMVPRVQESVGSVVQMRLSERHGSIIFAGESKHAGMEIEGDTEILQTGD